MDKQTKNRIKNLAAEILVAPLTAFAAGKEIVKKFGESENGQKTKETLKKTGYQVSEAVKKVSDTESINKSKAKVRDIAGKVGGVFTEGIGKVNEFLNDVDQRAEERMKEESRADREAQVPHAPHTEEESRAHREAQVPHAPRTEKDAEKTVSDEEKTEEENTEE